MLSKQGAKSKNYIYSQAAQRSPATIPIRWLQLKADTTYTVWSVSNDNRLKSSQQHSQPRSSTVAVIGRNAQLDVAIRKDTDKPTQKPAPHAGT